MTTLISQTTKPRPTVKPWDGRSSVVCQQRSRNKKMTPMFKPRVSWPSSAALDISPWPWAWPWAWEWACPCEGTDCGKPALQVARAVAPCVCAVQLGHDVVLQVGLKLDHDVCNGWGLCCIWWRGGPLTVWRSFHRHVVIPFVQPCVCAHVTVPLDQLALVLLAVDVPLRRPVLAQAAPCGDAVGRHREEHVRVGFGRHDCMSRRI